jgi:hypothetical protein
MSVRAAAQEAAACHIQLGEPDDAIPTRKPGEAILYRKVEKDGTVCYGRI